MKIRKAVGAIIVNDKRKFLLQKRKDQLGFMYWDILRGGIERGEKPLDALKRELYEELGIKKIHTVRRLNLSFSFEFPDEMKKIIGFDRQKVEMFFVNLGKEKVKLNKKEIIDFKFFNKRQFLEVATFETARTVFRKAIKKLNL